MPTWTSRPATDDDAGYVRTLRRTTMQTDVERLGFAMDDPDLQDWLDSFAVGSTRIIEVDGEPAAVIAVRSEPEEVWLEHFYVDPRHQGRGLGTAVLKAVLDEVTDHRPVRLLVIQGSSARRLYERHGFVWERFDDEADEVLVRHA